MTSKSEVATYTSRNILFEDRQLENFDFEAGETSPSQLAQVKFCVNLVSVDAPASETYFLELFF